MKKLIVGLLMAVLMSAGLVSTTATSAFAGCTPTEYVTCGTPTVHSTSVPMKKANMAKIRVRISTGQKKAKAVGWLYVTVTQGDTVRTKRVRYNGNGSPRTFVFNKLAAGTWNYTVTFVSEKDSRYKNAVDSGKAKVKGKKKARG
ncbi:hypothetical protein [Nocardioides bruguierae]|uniref:Uncharacterized protein n=1 Tax=Nocardioides bruguierae TaxID=2945102 RepID=A0A9X2D9P5_9ACTN|nr:hypothetical protein [Nocardioides bruguierae]MCM0621858.1 hypothetical protein [Nocardioides bruguierae]